MFRNKKKAAHKPNKTKRRNKADVTAPTASERSDSPEVGMEKNEAANYLESALPTNH